MDNITLKAYAKINLYLDVTGRRSDGYHMLETVMHNISLHDTVSLSKTDGGIKISCSDSSIPCNEKNIAYKCAEAFFGKAGISDCGVSIEIIKRIPCQAGMGGGSADGAAVLKGLNMLFETGFSEDELCALAAKIGADIPFCIKGGCGFCTGIGDIISPLPKLCGTVLIGKGTGGISTAEAYSRIDSLGYNIGMNDIENVFSNVQSLNDIAPFCRNLFEEASELHEIQTIKKTMMDGGALCSVMTGSGSAVFGIYNDINTAENTYSALKEMGFFSAVCEFV